MKLTNSITRTIGIGVLAVTTLFSMSVMTLAAEQTITDEGNQAEQKASYTITASKATDSNYDGENETVSLSEFKIDENGKAMISTDNGATWNEVDMDSYQADTIQLGNEDDAIIYSIDAGGELASGYEMSGIEIKLGDKAGEILYSEDGGEAWKVFDAEELGMNFTFEPVMHA